MAALARRGIIRPPRGPFSYPGTKPGFDQSHPAAAQCLFSGVAADGPNVINLLTGRQGTKTGATPVNKTLISGRGIDFSGGNDNVNFAFPTTTFSVATMAAIFTLTGSSANAALVFATNAANSYGIQIGASNATIQAVIGATAATVVTSPVSGVPYFVVVSNNGSPFNAVAVRLDNGILTTAATTTASPSAGDGSLYVGNRGTATRQLFGAVHALSFSNCLLTPTQLRQWAADPWSFWYPK